MTGENAAHEHASRIARLPLYEARDEFVKLHISGALRRAGGNQSHAARILRIDRTTLVRLMKRLGIASFHGKKEAA